MLQETATAIASLGKVDLAQRTAKPSLWYWRMKRIIDVTLAIALLIILAPFIVIIALAIKLDSPGPVIFVQERVGARRKPQPNDSKWDVCHFRFYKFRSMTHNADPSVHMNYIKAWAQGAADAVNASDSGPKFKIVGDKRITRVGKFLRKSSLDELPQLFNILKGDMSFVGPRPVPIYEAELYEDWHMERLQAIPGLTGLWQIQGRGEVSFDEMIEMDIEYIRNPSLIQDLKIMFLTIPAVLAGAGAR